ncbi:MAG TPA: glycosyltransferase [Candidatus Acidoferrales bacterium]|nr:glycosyltransferase [Candidatus Acidoferrales bacterium]
MRVSVVIPTYKRPHILRKTLKGYGAQVGNHEMLEILVVDDGSNDHSASVVEEFRNYSSVPIRYLYQENRGLAAARNHAIREAKGDLILFGDDDIIPSRSMVSEHVAWHYKNPEENAGVLGCVTWAPEVRPTPFMVWAGLYGPQFHFGHFMPGEQLEFWDSYFCNTSVKARFIGQEAVFNESFRQYGWEDIELSYRLYQKGYKLLYNPAAVGYHYKYETFDDTLRRIRKLNESTPIFASTDAGKFFFKKVNEQRIAAKRPTMGAARRLLGPLKAVLMPLFKPLLDTRIPLPGGLYERVLYHYSTRTLVNGPLES